MPSGGTELFEDLNRLSGGDLVICFGFQKLPREDSVLLSPCQAESAAKAFWSQRGVYAAENLQGQYQPAQLPGRT